MRALAILRPRRWTRMEASVLALALSSALLVLAHAGRCLAESDAAATAAAEQEAAVHFERGVEFYREGSLDAALVEFERAYDMTSNYRVLFNLAQVQAERHEYVAAIELFRRYLDAGGAELPEPRRKQTADEIALLESRVAQLWVESDVAGAKLFINDAPAGELPLTSPININPGVCNVRLEKSGHAPASTQVKVASGERPRVRLELTRAAAASGTEVEDGVPSRLPFWVSTSSALALGGAALTFGLLARDANDDLEDELERYPAEQENVDAARQRLRTYSGLTDATAAAALVAVGFAVYFAIAPPRRRRAATQQASNRQLQLAPTARGLALRGSF
jgi:tetratricopeptide (TPR) repeat protein